MSYLLDTNVLSELRRDPDNLRIQFDSLVKAATAIGKQKFAWLMMLQAVKSPRLFHRLTAKPSGGTMTRMSIEDAIVQE